jgi:hypothetical protein
VAERGAVEEVTMPRVGASRFWGGELVVMERRRGGARRREGGGSWLAGIMVIKSLCMYGRIQTRGDVVVIRKDDVD